MKNKELKRISLLLDHILKIESDASMKSCNYCNESCIFFIWDHCFFKIIADIKESIEKRKGDIPSKNTLKKFMEIAD